jgi:hypothetical protein
VLGLLLLVGAGALIAVLVTRGGGDAQPKAQTVVHTVTAQGTTVRQTVTSAPTPPPSTAPPTTSSTTPASGGSAASLNDAGYSKMRAGDYAGALPLLEQAVGKLSGSGSLTEAYADYNLAYTRRKLGQCTDVLPLLDNSQRIQGHRSEIDALRKDAQRACSG